MSSNDGKNVQTDENSAAPRLFFSRKQFCDCVNERVANGAYRPTSDSKAYLVFACIENLEDYALSRGAARRDNLASHLIEYLAYAFGGDVYAQVYDGVFAVVAVHGRRYTNIEDGIRAVRTAFGGCLEDFFADRGLWLRFGFYAFSPYSEDADYAIRVARSACDSIARRRDVYMFEATEDYISSDGIRHYVINYVKEALEKDWVRPFFQPIVDAQTGEVCDAEVLARWFDPVEKHISSLKAEGVFPNHFIPPLEDAHQTRMLDLKMLRDACSAAQRRMESGLTAVPISVNLSRCDLEPREGEENLAIVDMVGSIVDTHGVPRSEVHIEITESAMVDDTIDLAQAIARFHDEGFEVWLDDFGSGESSLNVLKDYDFDLIKVDMAFLRGFEGNERSKTVLSAVARLAKELGLRTLVEGVETQKQYEFLKAEGFGLLQGWLFGRPNPSYDEVSDRVPAGSGMVATSA